jgi:hypothetical protein
MDPETGAVFSLGSGGGSTVDREIIQTEYVATAGGTGYSNNDMIVRADVYDVSGSSPSLVATIWRNVSTGAALSGAPTQANLAYVGTKDAATESTLAAMNGKVPAKGQATKANSTPVTLASDQGAISVAEAQGSTVVETTAAMAATVAPLITASAGRRRFIVYNNSSGKLGLSTASNATLATCAIVLGAGEMWVESLAAASAWYGVLETGTATVPVQTVA